MRKDCTNGPEICCIGSVYVQTYYKTIVWIEHSNETVFGSTCIGTGQKFLSKCLGVIMRLVTGSVCFYYIRSCLSVVVFIKGHFCLKIYCYLCYWICTWRVQNGCWAFKKDMPKKSSWWGYPIFMYCRYPATCWSLWRTMSSGLTSCGRDNWRVTLTVKAQTDPRETTLPLKSKQSLDLPRYQCDWYTVVPKKKFGTEGRF